MALRGERCLLDCRFAARGNARSMFDSRARGEDWLPTRRFAARGSDGVYSDPWDYEIKRLRQRVRDLEEIKRLRQRVRDLEKIKRLRKRVCDLELQRDMRKAETESNTVVWGEGDDGEEYPFYYHPPRSDEPIYHGSVSEDSPKYDEDGVDFYEEEYSFVQNVLSGITIQKETEPKKDKDVNDCDTKPDVRKNIIICLDVDEGHAVALCGETVTTSDDESVGGLDLFLEVSINMPTFMEANGNFGLNVEIPLSPLMIMGCLNISKDKGNFDKDNLNFEVSSYYGNPRGGLFNLPFPYNIEKFESAKNKIVENNLYKCMLATNLRGPHAKYSGEFQHNGGTSLVTISKVNSVDASFDPGGINQERNETTYEVILFSSVMIIINEKRVDVPFDPEGKTRGRVFFKSGSMMQEHLVH